MSVNSTEKSKSQTLPSKYLFSAASLEKNLTTKKGNKFGITKNKYDQKAQTEPVG